MIVSGFLSNGAKDYIADFERNNRPAFRVKYWERPTIENLARENPELLERWFMSTTPFTPTDAEHAVQCEIAGCKHPVIYIDDDEPNPADTAQGWCDLCRAVARQQEEELLALGARGRRGRK